MALSLPRQPSRAFPHRTFSLAQQQWHDDDDDVLSGEISQFYIQAWRGLSTFGSHARLGFSRLRSTFPLLFWYEKLITRIVSICIYTYTPSEYVRMWWWNVREAIFMCHDISSMYTRAGSRRPSSNYSWTAIMGTSEKMLNEIELSWRKLMERDEKGEGKLRRRSRVKRFTHDSWLLIH